MTFAEHVEATRKPDGEADLAAAEQARAKEIALELRRDDPGKVEAMAAKAAAAERAAWRRSSDQRLDKQTDQPALSPLFDLDLWVHLGDGRAKLYQELTGPDIQAHLDMVTANMVRVNDAHGRRWRHFHDTLGLLPPGGTIGDVLP